MADGSAGRARVMTWNIWWRFGPRWRDRRPGLMHTIRAVDSDVVALQEVWGTAETSQAHELAGELGLHAAFAAPSLPPPPVPVQAEDQDVRLGLGLLSRWPINHVRPVELPARHRTPAPVALAAALDHPVGTLHVLVACLEWEPAYNDDRIAQAQALADLATDPTLDGPLPVVVAGDLNAAPESPVLRPLHDTLVDAWTAGGGDPHAVTLASSHPSAPVEAEELIDQRIDHIFVRPGQPRQRLVVESATLAGDAVDGLFPSDHRAVVCDLTWTAT
jgi:endonuclease/exonuclease/phosphatase family metal-dependent hydrolase